MKKAAASMEWVESTSSFILDKFVCSCKNDYKVEEHEDPDDIIVSKNDVHRMSSFITPSLVESSVFDERQTISSPYATSPQTYSRDDVPPMAGPPPSLLHSDCSFTASSFTQSTISETFSGGASVNSASMNSRVSYAESFSMSSYTSAGTNQSNSRRFTPYIGSNTPVMYQKGHNLPKLPPKYPTRTRSNPFQFDEEGPNLPKLPPKYPTRTRSNPFPFDEDATISMNPYDENTYRFHQNRVQMMLKFRPSAIPFPHPEAEQQPMPNDGAYNW
jgi:hypothetical protein